jgi:hypothetical protein
MKITTIIAATLLATATTTTALAEERPTAPEWLIEQLTTQGWVYVGFTNNGLHGFDYYEHDRSVVWSKLFNTAGHEVHDLRARVDCKARTLTSEFDGVADKARHEFDFPPNSVGRGQIQFMCDR